MTLSNPYPFCYYKITSPKGGDSIMATTKIALQLRLDEAAHRKVKVIAEREMRSLNAQIEYFIAKGIERYERENGSLPAKPGA